MLTYGDLNKLSLRLILLKLASIISLSDKGFSSSYLVSTSILLGCSKTLKNGEYPTADLAPTSPV